MEFNQVWDMGRLIDLGYDLYEGMSMQQPKPIRPYQLRDCTKEIRKAYPNFDEYPVYTHEVRMCVQTGTYLETGAHMYPDIESIADVDLSRLFVDSVVLKVPKQKDEHVTGEDLKIELSRIGESIHPGDALLIATGFELNGYQSVEDTPHFSYSAIDWAIKQKISIIGSDMAGWYDDEEKPNFWPMLMKSRVLVLAFLHNLSQVTVSRIRLIVLPLKIRGACASPVRVVGILPTGCPQPHE